MQIPLNSRQKRADEWLRINRTKPVVVAPFMSVHSTNSILFKSIDRIKYIYLLIWYHPLAFTLQ